MAAVQHEARPLYAYVRNRYVGLTLTLLAIFGAVWVLDGGKADEVVNQSTAITLTGIKGGVTPKVGEQAPNFTLQMPDGQSASLSDFLGRPVFVNFWASWCPPCRAEMPDIEEVAKEYRADGLVVLAVNMQEDREAVVRYAETLGLTFPLLLDRNGSVSTRYNVTGLPTSYFVDREGTIQSMNIGPLTPRGLRAKLSRILT
jgi:thiol-disulfide isomerase/thioredoxin